ncbi:MAG: hypothetical protein GTO53_05985 [Planctomycetales bacterium]|nr:hypothetical protein [Planctomycetales bacterium]NIM08694.1 hypothetical protein [Planctomycetales bacterium]NIN08164.1 hypothetical protein [Planctomycetales bacterium]NIN77291.1 hypothetical protein [Planctomycetales bacterium]NIO34479.1 hypothetical protein [Planctomycetales bacterium]
MAVLFWLSAWQSLDAEVPQRHYRHSGDMPPGAIGRSQLQRGGPLPGYFQPVQITAPPGVQVSLAVDGAFESPRQAPRTVGLLIGQVYRFKVSRIPLQSGEEVFPTVEVIDRLYPPPGKEQLFPIPVQLTQAELNIALSGKLVTRVIYLEDPTRALPIREREGFTSWFEAAQGDDPLQIADLLGRPVAILRLGARLPGRLGPDPHFLYGSPPFAEYASNVALQREVADLPPAALPGTDGSALGADGGFPKGWSEAAPEWLPVGPQPHMLRQEVEVRQRGPRFASAEDGGETSEGGMLGPPAAPTPADFSQLPVPGPVAEVDDTPPQRTKQ